jgi:hypothetical protein
MFICRSFCLRFLKNLAARHVALDQSGYHKDPQEQLRWCKADLLVHRKHSNHLNIVFSQTKCLKNTCILISKTQSTKGDKQPSTYPILFWLKKQAKKRSKHKAIDLPLSPPIYNKHQTVNSRATANTIKT